MSIQVDAFEVIREGRSLIQQIVREMVADSALPGGISGGGPSYMEGLSYLFADTDGTANIPAGRRLAVSTGVTKTDAGAGSTLTIAFDQAASLAGITGAYTFKDSTGTDTTATIKGVLSGSAAFAALSSLQIAAIHASAGRGIEIFAERTGGAGAAALVLQSSATLSLATVYARNLTLEMTAATSGSDAKALYLNAAAHTGLTASTEVPDVDFELNRTVQWATGALATQRAVVVQAPTYAFVGASTLTTAATFAITDAPQAGANATITNAYALWVQAGVAKIAGRLDVGSATGNADGNVTASGSLVCTGTLSTDGGTNAYDLGGYTAGAPTPTGFLTFVRNGTTYKVSVEQV